MTEKTCDNNNDTKDSVAGMRKVKRMPRDPKVKPYKRHNARKFALQALYEWLVTQDDLIDIEVYFFNEFNFKKTDVDYFKKHLHGVPASIDELDALMKPFLDRRFEELSPIELTVLRMAIFELKYSQDVPFPVVINEALELNKSFGATEGFKFVNGVLDKVASQLRRGEFEG